MQTENTTRNQIVFFMLNWKAFFFFFCIFSPQSFAMCFILITVEGEGNGTVSFIFFKLV